MHGTATRGAVHNTDVTNIERLTRLDIDPNIKKKLYIKNKKIKKAVHNTDVTHIERLTRLDINTNKYKHK